MAEWEEEEKWRRADEEVRRNLPKGVKLVRTLRGHTDWIGRIAWSPDGRMLASPSADKTIRVWDVETGECLHTIKGHNRDVKSVSFDPSGLTLASGSDDHTVKLWDLSSPNESSGDSGRLLCTLEGHMSFVYIVAFDPTGRMLASGSADNTVKLWDLLTPFEVGADSERLLCTLEGHKDSVNSVTFDPAGHMLASGSDDRTVRLWDVSAPFEAGADSWRLLRTLEGHKNWVNCVSFDPAGHMLASGSDDKTVKLWEAASGRLLRTLEGHTGNIKYLAFLFDGRLVASKGSDDTVRLWSRDTGACLCMLPELASGKWPPSLAFHPRLPLLATVGSDPGTPKEERSAQKTLCDRVIHIYELDLDVLLGQAVVPTVTYTSAKVVLVGESNVGKSYLAHRIAMGEPPEEGTIKSTHGMKFWPMEPENLSPLAKAPEGQRRDVVFWDMGGQEEYRLIHQLFLHDTTVALVLLDPTRGATAFKEAETWNKYLEKQLHGRAVVKLLVGAKLDQPCDTIDHASLECLVKDCGFAGYFESSALTGRGLADLCQAVAKAIDWDGLGLTSRPKLFQQIRDEIENRRMRGEVVLHFADLIVSAVSATNWSDEEDKDVDAVTKQLAAQGMIARSQVSTGEVVLVLQVQEIERYAGSLIVAARNNPRGVPALELQSIGQADFVFPGIAEEERLQRGQEKPVLECTVQLMLEHGICFQHEGLLIFPSLFASAPTATAETLPHAVSLYYDFAGAIDNIYASLVSWLVLARDFGRLRLWADRAEFEVKDGGLCGLRKVARPGGFAHVDVYFEADTPDQRRKEFISFVEDHLSRNGVEIHEHVAITCECGNLLAEETLRQRIARGDKDVVCPVCETRHGLTEGAKEARERDFKIEQHTWALRTQIEKLREKVTKHAIQMMEKAETKAATGPIRLLHLSDLHFTVDTPIQARLQWLLDDLKLDGGLGFKTLDYLVVSGDFTNKGCTEGFEKAYEFVSGLTQEFGLSAERCIFVPGNHDTVDLQEAYDWRDTKDGLKEGEWVAQGDIVLVRNASKYPLRFKPFSDHFYHKFLQRPYPTDYAEQGMVVPFWETGIQFLTLNSCWQIDRFNRKRSGVLPEAVANALKQAQKQEEDARKSGQLAKEKPLLRIAVWHHAVSGKESMADVDFLGNLQKNHVKLVLHGDVHEMRSDLIGYRHEKKIHVVGSGSFGARAEDRPEATARLYNVLEIARDLKSVRVHTREQRQPDGAWDGWHEWPDPEGGKGRVAYYDIGW
ncbi:MAG TPA: metallophosphoesterase [Candidatus Hydrogenedentes bacterium]|nr:metallophosphoesterase [Candidatus Hydrogenedentota bacterium]